MQHSAKRRLLYVHRACLQQTNAQACALAASRHAVHACPENRLLHSPASCQKTAVLLSVRHDGVTLHSCQRGHSLCPEARRAPPCA